jgi:ribonuclease III family protein
LEIFENLINENTSTITKARAKDYNSLVFAFVGDAVHTLFVRTYLASNSTAKAGKLHTLSNGFVKASAQAKILDELENFLTEPELQIAKTARNVKNKTVAKNADLEDYKKATSFEALIGYLYLTNQTNRMNEILNKSIKNMEKI